LYFKDDETFLKKSGQKGVLKNYVLQFNFPAGNDTTATVRSILYFSGTSESSSYSVDYELMKENQKNPPVKFYNSIFGWLFIRIPLIFLTCGLWLLIVEFPLYAIKKNNKKILKDYGKL